MISLTIAQLFRFPLLNDLVNIKDAGLKIPLKSGFNDLADDLFFWFGEFVTHMIDELISNIKFFIMPAL